MAHGWRRFAVLGLIASLVCWLPATADARTAVSAAGCSGQLIGDPGFESGHPIPWMTSSSVFNNSGKEPPHSGNWDAWMDGYGTTHTDTLTQTVNIPAGCHATLVFWLHIDTAETTTTTAYDRLVMKDGSTTLLAFSNLNHNVGYSPKTIALSGFAGIPFTLSFTATEDSSLQTSFVLDDVTITLS